MGSTGGGSRKLRSTREGGASAGSTSAGNTREGSRNRRSTREGGASLGSTRGEHERGEHEVGEHEGGDQEQEEHEGGGSTKEGGSRGRGARAPGARGRPTGRSPTPAPQATVLPPRPRTHCLPLEHARPPLLPRLRRRRLQLRCWTRGRLPASPAFLHALRAPPRPAARLHSPQRPRPLLWRAQVPRLRRAGTEMLLGGRGRGGACVMTPGRPPGGGSDGPREAANRVPVGR